MRIDFGYTSYIGRVNESNTETSRRKKSADRCGNWKGVGGKLEGGVRADGFAGGRMLVVEMPRFQEASVCDGTFLHRQGRTNGALSMPQPVMPQLTHRSLGSLRCPLTCPTLLQRTKAPCFCHYYLQQNPFPHIALIIPLTPSFECHSYFILLLPSAPFLPLTTTILKSSQYIIS